MIVNIDEFERLRDKMVLPNLNDGKDVPISKEAFERAIKHTLTVQGEANRLLAIEEEKEKEAARKAAEENSKNE